MIHLFGSVFGQEASTSKRAASAAETDQLSAAEATSMASVGAHPALPKFVLDNASCPSAQVNVAVTAN